LLIMARETPERCAKSVKDQPRISRSVCRVLRERSLGWVERVLSDTKPTVVS
jgi:hypothetical protein